MFIGMLPSRVQALITCLKQRGVAEPSFVTEWLEEPGHKSDKGLIPVGDLDYVEIYMLTLV
jgi:hypothetical protein